MSDHNPLTLKLNPREKVAYSMSDIDSNLTLCIGTLYLLEFYTDELEMPACYDGIIFLVAKFFTAFIGMLTGFLLDLREDIGPKGKLRPFILYVAVPTVLAATLQFVVTTFRLPVRTTIVTALSMIFGLSYSLMGYSYGTMIPAITRDLDERVQLVAYRQGSAAMGLLICAAAFIPLWSLFSDSTVDYACAALMFPIDGFTFMMLCYGGVKEHHMDTTPTGHKASILKSFCAILRNPPLLVLCIISLCILAVFNIKLTIQVYYTQYVLNDINLLSRMGFFGMGCILAGVLLVPATVKCSGRKRAYLADMVLWAVGDILNYFWGSNSFTFVMFSYVVSFGTASVSSLDQALVPDTVDYNEWKTDARAEGSVYTGYIFFRKISAVFTGPLSGIVLTQVGYIPNIAQSDTTLRGLRQLISIWPCTLAIIAALTVGFFCTLNEKRFALTTEEINRRRNEEMAIGEKTASVIL